MTGADHLIATAVAAGVDVCFANPGTTEMPLVAALDRVARHASRCSALFEGVCTGAADGYARMTGKPAMTLLHLGPGLANGLANLHNARRARSPVVNVIGDHATWHLAADAPLTSDIVSLAASDVGLGALGDAPRRRSRATRSRRDRRLARAARAGRDADRARRLPVAGRCAGARSVRAARARSRRRPIASSAPPRCCAAKSPSRCFSAVTRSAGAACDAAARVARRASGASCFTETFPARHRARRGDLPRSTRLPYFPEQAIAALAGTSTVLLAGARDAGRVLRLSGRAEPVGAGRLRASRCWRASKRTSLRALERARGCCSMRRRPRAAVATVSRCRAGALDVATLGRAVAALQPEGAIVVDEAATSGGPYWYASPPPRCATRVLGLTGGAIGQGLPTAIGAAIACPAGG